MTGTAPRYILVTGGYGFMGSHFVRRLYKNYPEYRIINLDLVTYAGHPDNLRDIETAEAPKPPADRRYEHIRGDVCDAGLVDRICTQYPFSLIVHFAAETHVDRSLFNFQDFIRTNVEGTRVMLEAARTHKVPRIVHISTDEVYGNVPHGFTNEDAPLSPSNPYAASKAAADMLARTYAKVYGLPVAIVRSGNNYGPNQYPEKLIPLSITNLVAGEKIPVHGDGSHVRSWVHVHDFCHAVDRIAHAEMPSVYNISGEHRSTLELIRDIAAHVGRDPEAHIERVGDRPNADFRYAPDSGKLERELGWKRQHSLKDMIPATIAWYRENEAWWRAVKSRKEFADHYEKQSKAQWY